ncbi:hypothetical protein [Caballeronia sp. INML1]|uniref:hypothetical protein n=1 Tax=Caballeronia sp. INML1 TaxID=2921760 RepID=UPI002028C11D|nr:hypothetical protein [Caballeronia sp. INML1]
MQHTSNTLYKSGRCFSDLIPNADRAESVDDWAVFETALKWRRLSKGLKINGHVVTRYQVREALSYVNLVTGEIIAAEEASRLGITVAGHVGEKTLRREIVLSGMRPEARSLAQFCLKFRNKRRGVTPGFDKLCHWYAVYADKRPDNVRRLLPALRNAGIMAGESLVGVEWQVSGSKTNAATHLNEDSNAERVFGDLMAQKGAAVTFECKRLMFDLTDTLATAPEWAEVVDAENEVYAAWGGTLPSNPAPQSGMTRAKEAALLSAIELLTKHRGTYSPEAAA